MSANTKQSGCDAFGVLLIVFLVLKIAGLVQWSWWFVLAPLWGMLALAVVVVIIAGLIEAVNNR